MTYIAVVARGGIISAAISYETEYEAERCARAWGDSGFDPECDDIKVFADDDELYPRVIYSYEEDPEAAGQ